ncbi:MAG: hypothetical protein A2W99_16340 [Bacteroidetes bacterium GWF2_33_16]|nr:MAG: hypothetical protein A2X00_12515 [Bacteroidetes bacterium GWE2_32_14]OFY08586.1 MAG: hypothetical protein A2W99_16340 [Bacteroidetes bacterium GWF2_33_16]
MRSIDKIYFLFFIGLIIIGCKPKPTEQVIYFETAETFTVIADTIITDVVIKNPTDDEWVDYTLRYLDKTILVDQIFEAVYTKKLVPYDFFNDTQLTIEQIKEIEADPDFSRDKIGKVQFEEKWYFDKKNNTMIKKVHSIMLAFELYNAEGEIKGYKPTFKVYLK